MPRSRGPTELPFVAHAHTLCILCGTFVFCGGARTQFVFLAFSGVLLATHSHSSLGQFAVSRSYTSFFSVVMKRAAYVRASYALTHEGQLALHRWRETGGADATTVPRERKLRALCMILSSDVDNGLMADDIVETIDEVVQIARANLRAASVAQPASRIQRARQRRLAIALQTKSELLLEFPELLEDAMRRGWVETVRPRVAGASACAPMGDADVRSMPVLLVDDACAMDDGVD
jgi:hypothetical protein